MHWTAEAAVFRAQGCTTFLATARARARGRPQPAWPRRVWYQRAWILARSAKAHCAPHWRRPHRLLGSTGLDVSATVWGFWTRRSLGIDAERDARWGNSARSSAQMHCPSWPRPGGVGHDRMPAGDGKGTQPGQGLHHRTGEKDPRAAHGRRFDHWGMRVSSITTLRPRASNAGLIRPVEVSQMDETRSFVSPGFASKW